MNRAFKEKRELEANYALVLLLLADSLSESTFVHSMFIQSRNN